MSSCTSITFKEDYANDYKLWRNKLKEINQSQGDWIIERFRKDERIVAGCSQK